MTGVVDLREPMKKAFVPFGALVAAAVAAASIAQAQQAAHDSRLMFDPSALQSEAPAPTAPAPKPGAKQTAKPAAKTEQPKGKPLQIDPASGTAARPVRIEKPKTTVAKQPDLGRVPFEKGSFGLKTNTDLKYGEMPDGTTTRGWDKGLKTANSPAYFGLSLKVPTDKVFAPLLSRPD